MNLKMTLFVALIISLTVPAMAQSKRWYYCTTKNGSEGVNGAPLKAQSEKHALLMMAVKSLDFKLGEFGDDVSLIPKGYKSFCEKPESKTSIYCLPITDVSCVLNE